MDWTGGTLANPLTISPGAALNVVTNPNYPTVVGATINQNGTAATVSGGGSMVVNAGSVINNTGSWTFADDSGMPSTGPATFNNTGTPQIPATVAKAGGTGITPVNLSLNADIGHIPGPDKRRIDSSIRIAIRLLTHDCSQILTLWTTGGDRHHLFRPADPLAALGASSRGFADIISATRALAGEPAVLCSPFEPTQDAPPRDKRGTDDEKREERHGDHKVCSIEGEMKWPGKSEHALSRKHPERIGESPVRFKGEPMRAIQSELAMELKPRAARCRGNGKLPATADVCEPVAMPIASYASHRDGHARNN